MITSGHHADAFQARGRSFEEAYFRTKDAELVEKLRRIFEAKLTKEDLRKSSGINNEEVLDRLVAANLRGELLTAFKLFPLVEMAWADGSVTKAESEAVLAAAVAAGIPKDGAGIAWMKEWLERGPTPEGRVVWTMYAAELRKSLTPTELNEFRGDLMKRAKTVAEASGGVFGFVKVSPSEKRELERITKALTHE